MTACCQPSQACCDKTALTLPVSRQIALVGNPNCGKTTLFNALTGAKQRIGNWPGVTVERKSGSYALASAEVEVIDLPGIYSLTQATLTSAIDERIAAEFIRQNETAIIINIVDASNLERHLYLTTQLLETGAPVILALNMMDVARARGLYLDIAGLSQALGCPVVALEANKGGGIDELKKAVSVYQTSQAKSLRLPYAASLQEVINRLSDAGNLILPLLEGDVYAQQSVSPTVLTKAKLLQAELEQTTGEETDILIADARYRCIQSIINLCLTRKTIAPTNWTARLDRLVLNRILGLPIFLGVMYLLFVFSINIGGAFQDFFDMSSQTIFVDGLGYMLEQVGAPTWLIALLANGLGKGINTTVTFIPVLGSMFLFLALLEDSGYMARAAFVIDRFMRALGLPGKAFVPMIVGFGCNVPAVMGARTLENKRDRILTIMMAPFMSCGARLAIFAVFTAAFFPHGGQNIVFALYLIGIIMAVLTGFLLRLTVLKGEASPLVMELPPYHFPRLKTLFLHAWQRLKSFVYRAGRLILPICVLIGALNVLNLDGSLNTGDGDQHSLLSMVGQWVTPIFAPMGIHNDNWPATVGLVTGVLAKEVVIGTLNTLYSQVGHFTSAASAGGFDLMAGLSQALLSIPQNLSQLGSVFGNPVLAQAPISPINQGVYGLMAQRFDGQIGAFAYLLFILLYFPCISTMAVMMRELHKGWSFFSGCWMTGVAYGTAVFFYQAATWSRHPLSSSVWMITVALTFIATIATVRWFANQDNKEVVYELA